MKKAVRRHVPPGGDTTRFFLKNGRQKGYKHLELSEASGPEAGAFSGACVAGWDAD